MQQHQLTQGSPEWHAHRAQFFNASDAPAMLGISPYKTRATLLQERATGIAPEITPQQQRIFDRGHQLEALARPIAEDIVGEELFPIVGTEGKLAASFDGITMLGDTVWEHKTLNQSLRYDWDSGNGAHLPEHYRAQMEQQLIVSDAERVLFMASEQGDDGQLHSKHCWYVSDPAMRQRIIDGWAQFEADLAAWRPEPVKPEPIAKPVEGFGALTLRVEGRVLASNLDAFKAGAEAFISRLPKPHELQTDQDFANAEAAVKACKEAETRIKSAKESAISQMIDVDTLLRTADAVAETIRTARLALEKATKTEKEARKTALVMQFRADFERHVQKLEADLQGMRLQLPAPDFGVAIKGLSSLESMRQKLTAALLDEQSKANTMAGRIAGNLQMLDSVRDYAFLFADRQALVTKDTETLELIIEQRIRDHQQAEAARLEAERERIRKEEEARAVKAAQEQAAREMAERQARDEAERQANAQAERLAQERQWRSMHGPSLDCAAEPAAPASPPTPEPQPAIGEPTLRLGEINTRLAPLSITEAGLRQLGFEPAGHDRRAILYHEHQWPAMCAAIVSHVQAAARIGANA